MIEEAAPSLDAATGTTAETERRARIEAMTRDAIGSLQRAGDFLAAQKSLSFEADLSFDVLQSNGYMLEFGGTREITLRRPDRLRLEASRRDGKSSVLYFDGKTISVDLPGHQAFVREEYSVTVYAAIDRLVDELGVPAPLEDLLSENFASSVVDRIESGFYVGPAEIGGRPSEHLAFRLRDVDVQLWIDEGEQPLISRIVIIYRRAEGRPQFRATLRNWDLSPKTSDSVFRFQPKPESEQLRVGSVAGPERINEQPREHGGRRE
ncbi:MAG: DUF2092 domain-containing protein [Myxococcota bacterium]